MCHNHESETKTTRVSLTCKECNKPFSISPEEVTWLKERGLALYVRCSECRKKRKLNRLANIPNLRDTVKHKKTGILGIVIKRYYEAGDQVFLDVQTTAKDITYHSPSEDWIVKVRTSPPPNEIFLTL